MSAERDAPPLPQTPIDRILAPIDRFMHVEAAGGITLLFFTVVALVLANSPFAEGYLSIWSAKLTMGYGDFQMSHSLRHWINDGLMGIFFFVIGLEVKRELVLGELREVRKAALPIAAAIGGMVVPAAVYLALRAGTSEARGWGIPMATDIAFAVGCLSILGSRVPHGFRVMILSLAIVDDIGAMLVIAIGYTEGIHTTPLLLAFALLGLVVALSRLGVRSFLPYVAVGAGVWLGFHESGVHATIAGVLVGLLTPARAAMEHGALADFLRDAAHYVQGEWSRDPHRARQLRRFQAAAREAVSPLAYLEQTLHPWSAFGIMSVFALANAGVPIQGEAFAQPVAHAVAAGLLIGKPVGIFLFSFAAVRLGLASLPEGVGWEAMIGGGLLAGIGFTMAIFIASLALDGPTLDAAKIGILGASVLAAGAGVAVLSASFPAPSR